MSKPVQPGAPNAAGVRYAALSASAQAACLQSCRALTETLYPGLDVEREIRATQAQNLGETVLLQEAGEVVGYGVCHCGPGTEAGTGKCYIKFGAVRLGATAGTLFEQLLDACETLAVSRGLGRLEAGVNLARHEAYRLLLARGFRTDIQGVAMHRDNEPGYNRPGVYLLDDWR